MNVSGLPGKAWTLKKAKRHVCRLCDVNTDYRGNTRGAIHANTAPSDSGTATGALHTAAHA